MKAKLAAFERLLKIMDELREKCPWDRKQTIHTLRNLTIEEVYELADAITREDLEGVKEEVGDLLLHMVFYAKIAEEKSAFTIADAINDLCDKLIKRHPHVYGNVKVADEQEVKKNWEQLKLHEGKQSILEGLPQSLPALIKAYRMQEKTKQVGFEWETSEQVWDKVTEELTELQEAVAAREKGRIEEEYGDVLFALVNYARFLGIDPENALEQINLKFKDRFQFIEARATKNLNDMTLEEMDQLWQQAKEAE